MTVINIYEAKTHLSKYIKQAKAGKPVYIGSYGKPEVKLIIAKPNKPKIKLGVWAHKRKYNAYKDKDLVGSDPDIVAQFDQSADKPFPT